MTARSPVHSQPSRSTFAVSSGLFQYPRITCGPWMSSSPSSSGGRSRVPDAMSTMRQSVSTTGSPMVPIFLSPWRGLMCVTGDVSVSPNPSQILPPVRASKRCCTSTDSGAEPETHTLTLDRSRRSTLGNWLIALNNAGTRGAIVTRRFSISLTIIGTSRGLARLRARDEVFEEVDPRPGGYLDDRGMGFLPLQLERREQVERESEVVGDLGDHVVRDRQLRAVVLDLLVEGEVRHNRDAAAGVLPLVLQLARGVQRIRQP